MNAGYLQEIADRVEKILNPVTSTREDGTQFTEGMDFASARTELKDILRGIGYSAEPGEEGTLKDLSSDQRLDLVLETNVKLAQGYGHWSQGQDPDLLELYPAQELFRAESGKSRGTGRCDGWKRRERWEMTERCERTEIHIEWWRGRILRSGSRSRALVCLIRPYDFNSGMDIMDVDRETAVELGVIEEKE
jgi:hypothetical protein